MIFRKGSLAEISVSPPIVSLPTVVLPLMSTLPERVVLPSTLASLAARKLPCATTVAPPRLRVAQSAP